jgi:molecular chaperone GrpE
VEDGSATSGAPAEATEGAAEAAGGQPEASAVQPTSDEAHVSALKAELEQARARIAELEAKLAESEDRYLRTVAESQNFRRRMEEQKAEERRFANRELVLGLLGVMDNFERALAAAEESASFESLIGGVRLTMRQMQDFLSKQGVAPIEALGKEFDPNYHEAVMRVEDSEHPDNTVVEELQRGYVMHDRVLRPSMVKVARSG